MQTTGSYWWTTTSALLFSLPSSARPTAVRTSLVRGGRTTAFGEAVLTQEGKEVIRATAAFARLGQDGQVFLGGAPPDSLSSLIAMGSGPARSKLSE